MVDERVFSDEELRIGALRSVDAIAEALGADDSEAARRYVRRLRREALSMLGNYDSWESSLLGSIAALEGHEAAEAFAATLPGCPDGRVRADDEARRVRERATRIDAAIERASDATDVADAADAADALEQATALHEHALQLHDRGMTRVLALMERLADRHGTDAFDEALTRAMAGDLLGDAGFRERAEALMHFTRVHFQPFEVIEDDEKLTFLCPVCPSGGRLLREGCYATDAGRRIAGPRDVTWGMSELPAYCCHEPVMEKASISSDGVPLFLVEPSADLGNEPCRTYLYKDPAAIPARYYARVGERKPEA